MLTRLRPLLDRAEAGLRHRRMASLPAGFPPTVSFSFDDFPGSARHCALPLLRSAGMGATWYAAAGLVGQPSPSGPIASAQDIVALHEAGHEVGCHTWSHLNAADTAPGSYGEDIDRNRAALAGLLPGVAIRSFAYPFGAVTGAAKREAAARSASCRGVAAGIVRRQADLALLPANRLYEHAVPLADVERLVADVRHGGGWAILYTHDVAHDPSPWGCSPGYFAAVVAAVAQAGLAVRTVGDVAAELAAA